MGILEHFVCVDINRGYRIYEDTPGGILVDVRTPQQHAIRRIPNSLNLPADQLSRAQEILPDRHAPIFVYGYGAEGSAKAVFQLREMGYTNVKNIGGFKKCCGNNGYHGPTEGRGWNPAFAKGD